MRKSRPLDNDACNRLREWHQTLIDRRAFLLGIAGGSLAALFGLPAGAESETDSDTWKTLDAVQQHLFPSEPDAPGAREINALDYLHFVVADPKVDAQERQFILQGVDWLNGIARDTQGQAFPELKHAQREAVLLKVAASDAGENWISTLIYYLLEALLTDPAYGGNPDGIGWKWLQHIPGFPRPTPDKIYPRLLS